MKAALLSRMSTRPNVSTAKRPSAAVCASSVTSTVNGSAVIPASRSALTLSPARPASKSATIMRAPLCPSARAKARPSPPPPVTIATYPSSET